VAVDEINNERCATRQADGIGPVQPACVSDPTAVQTHPESHRRTACALQARRRQWIPGGGLGWRNGSGRAGGWDQIGRVDRLYTNGAGEQPRPGDPRLRARLPVRDCAGPGTSRTPSRRNE